MKITFEEGRDNGYLEYFAISTLEVWKGKAHDELMWAELKPNEGFAPCTVRWEDDWKTIHSFESLDAAKDHVLKNWQKHSPHVNGMTFEIDEL